MCIIHYMHTVCQQICMYMYMLLDAPKDVEYNTAHICVSIYTP